MRTVVDCICHTDVEIKCCVRECSIIPRSIMNIESNKKDICTTISKGQQIHIAAGEIQFSNGGNTIWVHSAEGATTIRIKCTGKINVEQCRDSPISHCDIMVQGDINFCISKDAE